MNSNPWKIPLYLLLFGILTVSGVFFKNFGTQTYSAAQVSGEGENLEIFVQPESGRRPILEAIDSAQKEILVEVYLLSDKQLVDALILARNRGVKVQIMMEQHPFGGGNINKTTANRLQQQGIDFKWTNPTFALTHEKVIIVDNQVAFIMNQNLTQSSFKSNREFDIIDHNGEDIDEIRKIFFADWNRTGATPTVQNLVVSPDNSRAKLSALINSSQESLEMELEILQDRDMIKLLEQKAKNIEIRVILPSFSKVATNREGAIKLKNAGVEIKTLSSPYIHAKLILSDRSRAYVGSVNISDASLDQNREIGILISQVDIIDKLDRVFEQDWKKGSNF